MLAELSISNFAIIDRLAVRLAPGFNVLTGETGAGKSVVIDAVSAILGGKIGADFVRTGAEQAHVEAIFTVADSASGYALVQLLAEHGVEIEEGNLILSRDVYRSGRTVARVNGRAVPHSLLQQVGQMLVDIHGQSEHLSLLRSAYQMDVLDEYAGVLDLRSRVAVAVGELRKVRREMERLVVDQRELARRADLLRFQVNEIESARLREGEDEELARERNRLANAERLAAAADAAYQALYAGNGDSPAAIDRLGEAEAALAELVRLDPSLQPQAEALANAVYLVEEVSRATRSYRDAVEFNPARLALVEERLDLIRALKRKYGSSVAEVLAFGQQAAAELEGLAHGEERRGELAAQEKAALSAAGALAAELSRQRLRASRELAKAVERELADLNMKHARFAVALEQVADPEGLPLQDDRPDAPRYAFEATGVDKVTFLISPNPGEPLKPLAKIASGGEMSRLLLALKTVLSRADKVGTLIFDEIDVGIGGRSGGVVGAKLAGLAGAHQVICVTHLPQIACYADAHFRIAKAVAGERTVTSIEQLCEDGQIDELAAMMAGAGASTKARQSAAELLETARSWKETNRTAVRAIGA